MSIVTIDGRRYIPVEDAGEIKIVVLERGFIYVGRVDEGDPVDITIRGARALIRWGTENHLGELVNGPLDSNRLGDSCVVKARWNPQVIHRIEVNQDAWASTIS